MSLQVVSVVLVIWDGSLMFGLPHATADSENITWEDSL